MNEISGPGAKPEVRGLKVINLLDKQTSGQNLASTLVKLNPDGTKPIEDHRYHHDDHLDRGHPVGEVGTVVVHFVHLRSNVWSVSDHGPVISTKGLPDHPNAVLPFVDGVGEPGLIYPRQPYVRPVSVRRVHNGSSRPISSVRDLRETSITVFDGQSLFLVKGHIFASSPSALFFTKHNQDCFFVFVNKYKYTKFLFRSCNLSP